MKPFRIQHNKKAKPLKARADDDYDWVRNVRHLNPITGLSDISNKVSQSSGIITISRDRTYKGTSTNSTL